MRDCRLECVQAVIERQKRMPAEANDDRLFLDRQHRRSRFLWSRPSVHDRAARLPLAHRLLIDAVTSGERSQALFTMLYRSTDRLSRRGAPVKNLAHSASFDSCHKNAPSKCGTKQLGRKLINLVWGFPARASRDSSSQTGGLRWAAMRTDSEWKAIEPCLPNKPRGVPRVNDRRVLNGIFWVLRSGARWADLPERYGPPTTIYNRFSEYAFQSCMVFQIMPEGRAL